MSDNKALWRRVFTTDPKAVKPITGKQYSGNSPKPYWIVERLTDEFGPCGIGWGFDIVSERMEHLPEENVLHIAVVRFWYEHEGKKGSLEQIGQTKAAYRTSKGAMLVDEDAPKKSVTDALVKCASYLGFAGDIFSGRWDDSRYVAEANREWRERESEGDEKNHKPTTCMDPHKITEWVHAIAAAGADEVEALLNDGLAAATEVKDREAFVAIRKAGQKRGINTKATA
jgi:hypothetical protein